MALCICTDLAAVCCRIEPTYPKISPDVGDVFSRPVFNNEGSGLDAATPFPIEILLSHLFQDIVKPVEQATDPVIRVGSGFLIVVLKGCPISGPIEHIPTAVGTE